MTNMMDVFTITQIQCINCNCLHFVVLMITIVMCIIIVPCIFHYYPTLVTSSNDHVTACSTN